MTFHPALRVVAVLVAVVYLTGCSKQVERPAVEARHFSVDWDSSSAAPFTFNALRVQGIVLTPAQWPLEGSLKRLFAGDFLGVLDGFDFTFRSSKLPSGALQDIYDEGYLPVYVRVHNPTAEPRGLIPELMVVKAEPARELNGIAPSSLPQRLDRIDWAGTAALTLVALLIVVVIVTGKDSKMPDLGPAMSVGVDVANQTQQKRNAERTALGAAVGSNTPASEPGVLQPTTLAPGETREGFVFFAHRGLTVDWPTARLAAP